MKIETKFNIGQTVYKPDYWKNSLVVNSFVVNTVKVTVVKGYSGSGGCLGEDVDVTYSANYGDYEDVPERSLYDTEKQAKAALVEHKRRNPTHVCTECGTVVPGPEPKGRKKRKRS